MKIVKMKPGKDTSETLAPDQNTNDDNDLFQGEEFTDDELPWEYQGKSRRQVEGSYKIFALCLLIFFVGLLLYITSHL